MRRFLLVAAVFGLASGDYDRDGWLDIYFCLYSYYQGADQYKYPTPYYAAENGPPNFMLRNSVLQAPIQQWSLFSKNHAQATGFGGFVGRNYQWEDLVFGVEANYNYVNSLSSSVTNSMSRGIVNPAGSNPPAGHTYTYRVTAVSSAGNESAPSPEATETAPAP